ncbi:MAG: deoxyguanosinetriphosphate triphosphohydrolase [Clostridia bacterium]|nr:deoxyguanosinetriphosphate triphosphohydrolase [Clostridia bacterium]
MNVRQMIEKHEEEYLSPYASLAKNTGGRKIKTEKCDLRTEYQRDRDKIIHCKAFRRLKHKTQVFLTPEGDHYRTRLTHTLEVSQIARTIARALRLNEDLTEAIALGHDLGHTPFGHSGERGLDKICPYGFKHNEQSLRVVDVIENDGKGMNLTAEVRDGILNHTGDKKPKTLEGQIIRIADKIAYINHDIDDSIRAGVISKDEIPAEFAEYYGDDNSQRISKMIHSVVENSLDKNVIRMDEEGYRMLMRLREFMFNRVYMNNFVRTEEERAHNIISELYYYFLRNQDALPITNGTGDLHRQVCDYIAGMTDTYCVAKYKELFVPKSFAVM